jgi:rod shape determining protein RodA
VYDKTLAGETTWCIFERLRTWEADEGFHLTRSKLAIASGGLSGQGYRSGPFVKYYKFLPEKHNDLSSRSSAINGALRELCCCSDCMRCWLRAGWKLHQQAPIMFGSYVAAGISIIFAIQVIVNIGINIGLMPITGITLRLSATRVKSCRYIMAVGLVNNIGRTNRPKFCFSVRTAHARQSFCQSLPA